MLVVIAAVPLLAFAFTNIGLQRTVADEHAAMGHYGFMAALSFTTIGVALLAGLRTDGWRPTAWVAGLLPALLGVTSMIYTDRSSSVGLFWSLTAIATPPMTRPSASGSSSTPGRPRSRRAQDRTYRHRSLEVRDRVLCR